MMFNYNMNEIKTINVLLYLIGEKDVISVSDIMNIIAFSEVRHLNKYYRPVAGDKLFYLNNELGVVAVKSHDILMENKYND